MLPWSVRGPVGSWRLLRNAVLRLEHRLAGIAKLGGILLQAGNNTVRIGNLAAAKAKHIRRASQLLFERAVILLRLDRIWHGEGGRKIQGEPQGSIFHFK